MKSESKLGVIILSAEVEGISTRKDKTVKIVIGTQELKQVNEIFALQNQAVTVGFSLNGLEQSEVDMLRGAKFDIESLPDSKTPSQRLRGVLYRIWEIDNENYDDFNLFYAHKIELIINHYKSKLD